MDPPLFYHFAEFNDSGKRSGNIIRWTQQIWQPGAPTQLNILTIFLTIIRQKHRAVGLLTLKDDVTKPDYRPIQDKWIVIIPGKNQS